MDQAQVDALLDDLQILLWEATAYNECWSCGVSAFVEISEDEARHRGWEEHREYCALAPVLHGYALLRGQDTDVLFDGIPVRRVQIPPK